MARQIPLSEKQSLNILDRFIEGGWYHGELGSQREKELFDGCNFLVNEVGKATISQVDLQARLQAYRDYFAHEMKERPPVSLQVFQDTPELRQKLFDGLERQKDFSEYYDDARLTERERQCYSMKAAYRHADGSPVPLAEIARRLGIHRSRVQDHIAKAERKLTLARQIQRDSKRSHKADF